MALIRQESLLQYQDNNSGAITASVGRYMHGVIEDYIDGQVLNLTTLINNIQTGASAVGNVEEVQLKGAGNSLLSTANFKYDLLNSDLLITNSGADFTLPNDESNDFNISIDGAPNTLFTIGGDGNITLGDTDSNITLRRGVTALDENLILEENQLTLSNADLIVTTSSDTNTPGFSLTNSIGDDLITYNNDGTTTRNNNFTYSPSINVPQLFDSEILNLTLSDGGVGNAQAILKNYNLTVNSSTNTFYSGIRTSIRENGTFSPLTSICVYEAYLQGNITAGESFLGNGRILAATRRPQNGNSNPQIDNGWSYISSNDDIGLESNHYPQSGGVSNLLRLNRYYRFGAIALGTISLDEGEGTSISFSSFVALSTGGINRSYTDTIENTVASLVDADAPLTTQFTFNLTQDNNDVAPLSLIGKDVTIGTTNSNIILQRGTTALDEALELTSESLELTNANMTINGTATDSTSAFTVNNSAGTRSLNVTNDGYILGGTTVARVGFNPSNYTLYQGGSIASFVNGVVRMNLLADSLTLSVPLSVSSITNVNNLTSGAEMIFRSASGAGSTPGFDMRYYAGKGGGSTFVSGTVKLGYRQQNNVDVDILTIRERTANSTDGIARIIFAIEEEYADNAAATGAGLPVNTLYKTPTGEVRIVV